MKKLPKTALLVQAFDDRTERNIREREDEILAATEKCEVDWDDPRQRRKASYRQWQRYVRDAEAQNTEC